MQIHVCAIAPHTLCHFGVKRVPSPEDNSGIVISFQVCGPETAGTLQTRDTPIELTYHEESFPRAIKWVQFIGPDGKEINRFTFHDEADETAVK